MWLARDIELENYANGTGIRMVIWNQGCRVHCEKCHNPETWEEHCGKYWNIADLKEIIKINAPKHKGITLSGGDPFLQPEENKELAKYAHALGLDVWAYCGLTFEQLLKDKDKKDLLIECDVLVDGPFIYKLRDITLPFRGSSNQRIIDVQASLKAGKTIIKKTAWVERKNNNLYVRKDGEWIKPEHIYVKEGI